MPAVGSPSLVLMTSVAKQHNQFTRFLRKHLLAAHAILHPPLRELSLALVGDKKMADLHLQFLAIPGPTDVLTFPLELDKKGRLTSGEVVVCLPEARRRCAENGNALRAELLLYSLHGLLHLCGHDDKTNQGFAKMHRTEDEILSRLGVGPVYNAPKMAKQLKLKSSHR